MARTRCHGPAVAAFDNLVFLLGTGTVVLHDLTEDASRAHCQGDAGLIRDRLRVDGPATARELSLATGLAYTRVTVLLRLDIAAGDVLSMRDARDAHGRLIYALAPRATSGFASALEEAAT